jgi:hypothetical protein
MNEHKFQKELLNFVNQENHVKYGRILNRVQLININFLYLFLTRGNKSSINKEKTMNFGEAFEQVRLGKGMRLPSWNEEVVVQAQYPDKHSKMTAPYLYVESIYGTVPWKETMNELFSELWEVV